MMPGMAAAAAAAAPSLPLNAGVTNRPARSTKHLPCVDDHRDIKEPHLPVLKPCPSDAPYLERVVSSIPTQVSRVQKTSKTLPSSRQSVVAASRPRVSSHHSSTASLDAALHASIRMGYADKVAAYITAGANVRALTHNGDTPLHLAARRAHLGVAKLLLSAGVDVGVLNQDGCCASELVQPQHRHSMLRDTLREAEVAWAIAREASIANTRGETSVEQSPAPSIDHTDNRTAVCVRQLAL